MVHVDYYYKKQRPTIKVSHFDENDNYDLTQIKKNSEICINRIIFEMNKIKYNLSILTKQNLDYNSDLVNINEKPPLPENMIANNKDFEEVEEFTGFEIDKINVYVEGVRVID